MEQTRILLTAARVSQNYTAALNVMYLVQTHLIPTTIEDIMYGYMVAKDWCSWIKTPGEPKENPLQYDVDDDVCFMFDGYVLSFEAQLVKMRADIEAYIAILSPNLIQLYRGRNQVLSEDVRLLYRSLRYTAQLFEAELGDGFLNRLLDSKQVPPMSGLGASRVY